MFHIEYLYRYTTIRITDIYDCILSIVVLHSHLLDIDYYMLAVFYY